MKHIKFISAVGMAAMLAVLMLTGCKKENTTISGITINSTAETLEIGSTVTLSYIYEPSDATVKDAIWSSSNQTVATVDQNGTVTGVAAGTANVTVTVNEQKTATCAVTVLPKLTGIKLSTHALTIKVDSTREITYTTIPEGAKAKKEEWLTSDDDIAESLLNDGQITGIKEGTATIYLLVNDDFIDSCKVTVEKNYPPMTGIKISSTADTIKIDSTVTLSYTVQPEGAKVEKAKWSSSAEFVATVDTNGVVKGISEGTATITITVNDKYTATCEVTVEKNLPAMTGITISSEAETINVGSTVQLSYTVEPAEAKVESAVWSSSDPAVATVDQSGLVTAIGVGNATIIITVNGAFAKECAVRVQESLLLPGKFTVNSSGKQVQFTKGNLWCNASTSPVTYSFESAQNVTYATLGQSSYTAAHVCQFYWTNLTDYQSGTASYMPYASSYSYSAQSESDKFWCGVDNSMTIDGQSGLYALSNDEWKYLFESRTNASGLYQKGVSVTTSAGTVANCVVIAPDACLGGYTFDNAKTSYTAEEWATAEAGGLVCLPSAGLRGGSSPSRGGAYGYYWSATPDNMNETKAFYLSFTGSVFNPSEAQVREFSRSVRLVCSVSK